ncbi:hypothetical protein BJ138DRAFT_1149117 [Hygrophoropsis aurantiaca]|uniref:Uncharacterized protein n=1 Tax=Hygrophoropsis aurantiaca TaxID=72124 RepID=A0ACB8AFA7_9AGAM|nr:hypothetical protein BJ138DRAFT_1149117 [Hygrophoropsis aurantiaca]
MALISACCECERLAIWPMSVTSLPESTTVLIVGAGPTGLTTALSLYHHGCRDFVIVDAVLEGNNTSRAHVIHAATLEALDSIESGSGLAERGIKGNHISLRSRTAELACPSLDSLKKYTSHPYVLFIPQHIVEQAFVEKLASLGVHIFRPKRVVGFRQSDRIDLATDVSFDDGSTVTAKYVIGADGARSVVRTSAGIGFRDPDGEIEAKHNLAQMILADVTFKGGVRFRAGMTGVMTPQSFFVCAPFPESFNMDLARNGQEITNTICRIGCGVPISEGPPPSAPSKEFMQNLINRFGPTYLSSDPTVNKTPVEIDQMVWSTRFRTHSAIADTFFSRFQTNEEKEGGAILLVGDAAHIHSPAGGQGMNLGIRDAVFLGEAVAEHFRLYTAATPLPSADVVLRNFADARKSRAVEVIGLTKGILKMEGASYDTYLFGWIPISPATVRDWVLWALGKTRLVQGRLAWQVSGLGRR